LDALGRKANPANPTAMDWVKIAFRLVEGSMGT
jgi:hypothetical protein